MLTSCVAVYCNSWAFIPFCFSIFDKKFHNEHVFMKNNLQGLILWNVYCPLSLCQILDLNIYQASFYFTVIISHKFIYYINTKGNWETLF